MIEMVCHIVDSREDFVAASDDDQNVSVEIEEQHQWQDVFPRYSSVAECHLSMKI